MAPVTRAVVNNPRLLTWARTAAGYEIAEIAQYLGKSPEVVEAWESGAAHPTYRQLQRFAGKVGRTIATLYLPQVPAEPAPPKDFRSVPGARRDRFGPEALLAFRELRNALSGFQHVAVQTGTSISLSIPRWEGLSDAAERATVLREQIGISLREQMRWRDAYRALDAWRWALSSLGVLVQVFPVPIDEARGFSLIHCDLGGIGLSSKDTAAGRIFSLFHEVAHLCIGRPGVSGDMVLPLDTGSEIAATERYCDEFAAAFLLPPTAPEVSAAIEELRRDFSSATATRIGRMFSVSRNVVARRAFDAGRIEPRAYWEMVERWRREFQHVSPRRGHPDFMTTVVSHRGRPLIAKVLDAMDAGAITKHEASQLLSLRPGHIEEAREHIAAR